MVKIEISYLEGILHSSGDPVPFDSKCNRVPNGYQDTNNATAKAGSAKARSALIPWASASR
jgi:hypothetical protein